MGMVFGKIDVETPKYELIKATLNYEILNYSPSVIAQVRYDPSQFKNNADGGFMILANYTAALGNPQNKKPETMPENTGTKTVTMQSVLPGKYKRVEEASEPMDERVVGNKEGGGEEVRGGDVWRSGDSRGGGESGQVEGGCVVKVVGEFLLGRYNPPWTLPMFRKNDAMLPVEYK